MVKYSPEIAAEICERLANGESLRAICRDSKFPTEAAVRGWVIDDKDGFASQYARAREIGYERLAEDIMSISDEPVGSLVSGGTDTGAVQKQRLQVDTRKWLLSKMLPKKYGDKQFTEHSGGMSITVATGVTEPGSDLV